MTLATKCRQFLLHMGIGAALLVGCRPTTTGKYNAADFFAQREVAELADAARRGDVAQVDRLLDRGVDVNSRGKDGVTPLMYSMSGANTQGFRRLLERGADPNLQAESGLSAVSGAAARGESESLQRLLEHGGNPNLRARRRASCTYDPNPTPIFDAIGRPNPENVRVLIEAGADLNVRDSLGMTPLMSAAALGFFDVVEILLKAGADFRAADPAGATVCWYILDSNIDPESDAFKSRERCLMLLESMGVDIESEKARGTGKGGGTL